MSRFVLLFFLVLPTVLSAFVPEVKLSVSPTNIVISEKADVSVSILLPQRMRPSFEADFIPEGSRVPLEYKRAELDGKTVWWHTVRYSIEGKEPGVRTFGPVTVRVPVRTDFFGMVSKTADFQSPKASLTVVSPPETDRPKSYCGAVADSFNASSFVDANVCTSGDPILFTVELSGATDSSMVYAPAISEIFKGTSFRLDAASLKTETLSASKRFTWRIRAVGAGTVEIPAVDVAWFDLRSREYKVVKTVPIPIQIKAGEQASLGSLDEIGGETDEFPMPDGIDIPFSPRNFTLKHAISLAVKARTDRDFAAAAERYAAFVESLESDKRIADADDGIAYKAVHMRNLA